MKTKIVLTLVLGVVAVYVAGCSNAGPYVTDVSFDGEGNLLVTKNMIVFNGFFGTVETGSNPQTIVIKTPKAMAAAPQSKSVNEKSSGVYSVEVGR